MRPSLSGGAHSEIHALTRLAKRYAIGDKRTVEIRWEIRLAAHAHLTTKVC